MEHIIDYLDDIPIWIWVVTPFVLLGATVYFTTKELRKTGLVMGVVCAVVILVIFFRLWESFLYHHFLGTFSAKGKPIVDSTHGWDLFLETWPIWTLPVVLMGLIYGIIRFYQYLNPPVVETPKKARKTTEQMYQEIADEMELSEIRIAYQQALDDVAIIEKKHDKLKEKQDNIEKEKTRLIDDNYAIRRQCHKLQTRIDDYESIIQRHRLLIDDLKKDNDDEE